MWYNSTCKLKCNPCYSQHVGQDISAAAVCMCVPRLHLRLLGSHSLELNPLQWIYPLNVEGVNALQLCRHAADSLGRRVGIWVTTKHAKHVLTPALDSSLFRRHRSRVPCWQSVGMLPSVIAMGDLRDLKWAGELLWKEWGEEERKERGRLMEEEVDLVTTEECREFGNLRKCIIVYVGACEWENYVNYIQAGDWQLELPWLRIQSWTYYISCDRGDYTRIQGFVWLVL